MGTLVKNSPVETSVSVQIVTRSVGMGPWKIPCGITAIGVPTPAAEGGVGEVARKVAIPGQLTSTVELCGLCGVPAAAAGAAPASAEAMAAMAMMTMRRMGPPIG